MKQNELENKWKSICQTENTSLFEFQVNWTSTLSAVHVASCMFTASLATSQQTLPWNIQTCTFIDTVIVLSLYHSFTEPGCNLIKLLGQNHFTFGSVVAPHLLSINTVESNRVLLCIAKGNIFACIEKTKFWSCSLRVFFVVASMGCCSFKRSEKISDKIPMIAGLSTVSLFSCWVRLLGLVIDMSRMAGSMEIREAGSATGKTDFSWPELFSSLPPLIDRDG